jgi:hypothetical protein
MMHSSFPVFFRLALPSFWKSCDRVLDRLTVVDRDNPFVDALGDHLTFAFSLPYVCRPP